MEQIVRDGLLGASLIASAVFGFILGIFFLERRTIRQRRESFRDIAGSLSQQEVSQVLLESRGLNERIILFILECSSKPSFVVPEGFFGTIWGFGLSDWSKVVCKAGLEEVLTKEGIIFARMVLSLACGFIGLMLGLCFSEILGVLLLGLGFFLGYSSVVKALKSEAQERVYVAEKQLSEMLEIVILGLRSGLSFDRSLEFYCTQFSGSLSRLMRSAYFQWNHGLVSRTESLKRVAASYDSPLFERTFEGIVRSLRFGTSLSENLHVAAVEARAIRKSKLEERVAKAPVKMLLPVGTLILPAMLLLVVGPILLDLINGF